MPDLFQFFWHDLVYQPLYNLLIFFYSISPGKDMGLAVIFLTILIRVILLPFSIRAARSEHQLDRLQPLLDEIKVRFKYNIEKQREATKTLLKRNKIGVYSSFISLLFQIFVFVVLYKIFSSGLQQTGYNVLYSFNLDPRVIDPYFFNWFNLIIPNHAASLFAAGVVFFHQAIRRVKHISEASTIEKGLLFGLPIGTYFATILLPSAKALFIATSVCFSLWIRLIKWLAVRFFLRDEKLKSSIDDLWTS